MHYSQAATIFLIALTTAGVITVFIMLPLAMALDHGRDELAKSAAAERYAPWLRAARRLHARALIVFFSVLAMMIVPALFSATLPIAVYQLTTCALMTLAWQAGSVVWGAFILMDSKPNWIRVTKRDPLLESGDQASQAAAE